MYYLERLKVKKMEGIDICVICGDYVPEGQQVCDKCKEDSAQKIGKYRREERDYNTGKKRVRRSKRQYDDEE